MAPDPPPSPASYRAAADELDQILADLDDDHLDVDVLADKVRRAAELIAFCRGRISSARMEVEQVVADLDPPSAPTTQDAPGDPGRADDDRTWGGQGDDEPTQLTPTEDPTLLGPTDDDPTLLADGGLRTSDRPGPAGPAAN